MVMGVAAVGTVGPMRVTRDPVMGVAVRVIVSVHMPVRQDVPGVPPEKEGEPQAGNHKAGEYAEPRI
jgi:hypothetical protein